MSAVHEYVHQRAQEKRQPDEYAQDMGAVLGEQQHTGNNQKADQHQPCRRGEKAALIAMAAVVLQRHWHPSALIRRRPPMISGRRTLLRRTDLSGAPPRPAGVGPWITPSFCLFPSTSVIRAREPADLGSNPQILLSRPNSCLRARDGLGFDNPAIHQVDDAVYLPDQAVIMSDDQHGGAVLARNLSQQ